MPDEQDHGPSIDYYETMQVSPNADFETIERVYRILAKRYHPDNNHTGDAEKFRMLAEAFRVLSDSEKRAAYDVKYERAQAHRWRIFVEPSPSDGVETDRRLQEGILALLYTARRQDASNPGVGTLDLERLFNCPHKHMEFHVWYLREKGWIQRGDDGRFAITASGVDTVRENGVLLKKERLLPAPDEVSIDNEQTWDSNRRKTFHRNHGFASRSTI